MKIFERGLDIYKERGDNTGLLAEPINLLSNIAFFAGAIMCIPFCRGWVDGILAFGMILVGIGSTAYHAYPHKFTLLWDTTSIVCWITFYFFTWAFFMMKIPLPQTLGLIALFGLITYLFIRKFGNLLHDNGDYVPVIILMLLCGSTVLYKSGHAHILVAGIFGTIALIFRTIDRMVKIAVGTHWIWHMLNGFLMALLTIYVSVYVNV